MWEPSEELDQIAHVTIGAAIAVHRELGPGFLESIYAEAMAIELELRKIPFASQVPISIEYQHRVIGESRLDLVVAGQLVVELKAVSSLHAVHVSQVISYLKAGSFNLGLLLNFNTTTLREGGIRRVVLGHEPPPVRTET